MSYNPYVARPITMAPVATDVERRIADACNRAVFPYLTTLPRMPKWVMEGRVDFQLVDRVCRQLAWQGLAPADLDSADGQRVIQLVADVVMRTDYDPTRIFIHDEIIFIDASEWQTVMRVAHHLLWGQPRRYEVDQ